VLTNSEGMYLAAICGNVLHWVKSPNDIPERLLSLSHEAVKARWLALRQTHDLCVDGLSIKPIDFYAHRASPHLWCASDD
jgi:hypothetical protein